MPSSVEQLASYAADLCFEDLHPRLILRAKQSILDSIGCMVGGSQMTPSRTVFDTLEAWSTPGGDSTVAGTPWRAPLSRAIYANAYFSNALDFDDTYKLLGHPGATIVPPAVTLAEQLGSSGRDLLAAVVAGYEVSLRVAMAIEPSPQRSAKVIGFSTWQVFGAAVVAAKLLNLNVQQFAHALAIAATNAPVPFVRKSGRKERPYAWVKNNYGWTSMGGLLAAQLASNDFRGNLTILDGDTGFWRMAGSDRCNEAALTDGLGERDLIDEVSFKPYPACRHTHSAIDALIELTTRHSLDPSDVGEIVVESDPPFIDDFMVAVPDDIIDAQFSVPYVAAMVVLGKTPGYDWLDVENLTDADVLSVAARVRGIGRDEFTTDVGLGRSVRVTVTTKNGNRFVESVAVPSGDPMAPLSRQELTHKFVTLASPILGRQVANELVSRIETLETADNSDWVSVLGTADKR